MKRKKIWFLGILIGALSLILLYMQYRNAKMMVRMRQQQFDESVLRSLDQASHDLERNETFNYLESIVQSHERELDSIAKAGVLPPPLGIDTGDSVIIFQPKMVAPASQLPMIGFKNKPSKAISQSVVEAMKNAYVYQRALLDEVIYTVLYNASVNSPSDRVDSGMLDAYLTEALHRNGINIPFHFRVMDSNGAEVFRCIDYDSVGIANRYSMTLFRNDPSNRMGVVEVHFPTMHEYIMGALGNMFPVMLFTFLIILVFWYTTYQLARQKKVSEMKNDFINNMTHEFKTPLASISLAAEMLSDKSVKKTEGMYSNLAGIISNETRRLRFQVEKVLQMSLFDHDNIRVKSEELDINQMLENVVKTFQLRIQQSGGKVDVNIEAFDPFVYGDEMHLTNVFFNLLDNAVKYSKPDADLMLSIHTENVGENLQITIQDNGVGIQKSDLSHIFERFYRVHTGNQHNVKGFGLGLAYVHTIIRLHHGRIKVESEYGEGTRFIITLPTVKE